MSGNARRENASSHSRCVDSTSRTSAARHVGEAQRVLCISFRSGLFDPKVPGALNLPLDALHAGQTLAFRQEGDLAAELHCLELIAGIELGIDGAVDRLLN